MEKVGKFRFRLAWFALMLAVVPTPVAYFVKYGNPYRIKNFYIGPSWIIIYPIAIASMMGFVFLLKSNSGPAKRLRLFVERRRLVERTWKFHIDFTVFNGAFPEHYAMVVSSFPRLPRARPSRSRPGRQARRAEGAPLKLYRNL